MVDQRVVAVDPQIHLRLAHSRAAYAKENIVQRDRVLRMLRTASLGPYVEQHWRLAGPRIEEQSGNFDSVGITCCHRRRAFHRAQRRIPEP